MGALEFEPEFNDDDIQETVDMSSLATLASKIYNDRDAAAISPEDSLTMKKLVYLGTSAGGMRPKAVIAYNTETGEFRSGQVDLPENYRQAFEMNRFQDMTYKEIASHLNISSKTVDYRIQQALKILRIKLKDYMPLLIGLLT